MQAYSDVCQNGANTQGRQSGLKTGGVVGPNISTEVHVGVYCIAHNSRHYQQKLYFKEISSLS